jgi:epoxyqueuosine reductase QueG
MTSISLKERAEALGVDFFGVADLAPAYEAILEQGGPEIAAYPRAISVGITLMHPIVDLLPRRAERAVAVEYRSHAYDVVNARLDFVTSRLGSALQRAGFRALPIPASKRVDDERLCASFSHKLAAHLAGLGWIGKSCLLITPESGPRVRWATVLTDAPVDPTGKAMKERCGECTECVDICPVQAFTGRAFRKGEPREARYDAAKCDQYFASLRAQDPETAVCGLCLYVCPYGKSIARGDS